MLGIRSLNVFRASFSKPKTPSRCCNALASPRSGMASNSISNTIFSVCLSNFIGLPVLSSLRGLRISLSNLNANAVSTLPCLIFLASSIRSYSVKSRSVSGSVLDWLTLGSRRASSISGSFKICSLATCRDASDSKASL